MENYAREIVETIFDKHALYSELEDRIADMIDYEAIAERLLAEIDLEKIIDAVALEIIHDDMLPY